MVPAVSSAPSSPRNIWAENPHFSSEEGGSQLRAPPPDSRPTRVPTQFCLTPKPRLFGSRICAPYLWVVCSQFFAEAVTPCHAWCPAGPCRTKPVPADLCPGPGAMLAAGEPGVSPAKARPWGFPRGWGR